MRNVVLGALLGWACSYFMPILVRRIRGRAGVLIHIEQNPVIFDSGVPPWIGYGFVFPDEELPLGVPPPGNCQEWWPWAKSSKGIDAGTTKIRVTVFGDSDTTVIVQALRVAVVSKTEPLNGTYALCAPPGGPDIIVRHISVDLDGFAEAVTSYVGSGGRPSSNFSLQLKKGEAEAFNIEASASWRYCEWIAELYLLIDGKQTVFHIDDDGRPFRTTAASHLTAMLWREGKWAPLKL